MVSTASSSYNRPNSRVVVEERVGDGGDEIRVRVGDTARAETRGVEGS